MFQVVLPLTFSAFNVVKFIFLSLFVLPVSEIGLRWLQDNHRKFRLVHGFVVTPKDTGLGVFGLHSTFDSSSSWSKVVIAMCTLMSIGMALLIEYGVDAEEVDVMEVMNTTKGLTIAEWTSGKHFDGYQYFFIEGGFELDEIAGMQAKEICGGSGMTPKWSNPISGDFSVKCFQENMTRLSDKEIIHGSPYLYEPRIGGESGYQPVNIDLDLNATVEILQRFDIPYFGFRESAFIGSITLTDSVIMNGACKAKASGFCFVHNDTHTGLLLISLASGSNSFPNHANNHTTPSSLDTVHMRYNWLMHLGLKVRLLDENMVLLSIRNSKALRQLVHTDRAPCCLSDRMRRGDLARIGSQIEDVLRNGKIYSEGLRGEGSYRVSTIQRPSVNLFFVIPLCIWVVFMCVLLSLGLVLRWRTRLETNGQALQYQTSTKYLVSLLGHSPLENSNGISLADWNVGIITTENKKKRSIIISRHPIDTKPVDKCPIV